MNDFQFENPEIVVFGPSRILDNMDRSVSKYIWWRVRIVIQTRNKCQTIPFICLNLNIAIKEHTLKTPRPSEMRKW